MVYISMVTTEYCDVTLPRATSAFTTHA